MLGNNRIACRPNYRTAYVFHRLPTSCHNSLSDLPANEYTVVTNGMLFIHI